MANSLSEGFIRQTYIGLSGVHHAVFPINFDGTPVAGVEPSFTQKDGGTIAAEAGYAALLSVYLDMFDGDTLFGLVEVYAVDADTEERTFIYGWDANTLGTNANPSRALSMDTLTFKTIGGGVLRVTAMEGIYNANTKLRPPFVDGEPVDALADYVISDDSILIGRDNTYAFAPISLTVKTSDALRKRMGL